jgi:hypothetical protein
MPDLIGLFLNKDKLLVLEKRIKRKKSKSTRPFILQVQAGRLTIFHIRQY